ncbi:hypothetical protein KDH82_07405 [Porphyromonas gingivalis]|nr:hypothetical protein KDH82_07405 [Porphyromonas gingivalis]QUI91016.1 hypothetical protein KC155_07395 [Porphyromonas gingivalis]
MKQVQFLSLFIVCCFFTISAYAQSENKPNTSQLEDIQQEYSIKINGYLRAGIFGGEKEIRNYYGEGALKLEVPIGISASAFSEVRYKADGNNNHKFDIREAYVNLNLGKFDFRVGEQIVLWGRADGFNPTNNVTPQDFCVFSPEEDDKRLGNFVVKGVFNPYPFRIEVDWIPVYKSSLFPFIGKPVGDGVVWNNEKRPYRWKNQSFGVKIDLEKPSFDLSLSYYNGLHKFPGIAYEKTPSEILLSQEPYRVHVVGMDFSTSLGNYGLRGEFACSLPEKSNNSVYSVPNKQMEYTIGIDRSWDNFSLIVQYIGKYIPDLETDIKGNPIVQKLNSLNRIVFTQHERWNHSVSVRPALSLLHETLNVELLGLCQFSTKEYFFQPKIRYAIADAVTLTVGGQLFYGPDDRLFGILEKTKNSVFTELKVSF